MTTHLRWRIILPLVALNGFILGGFALTLYNGNCLSAACVGQIFLLFFAILFVSNSVMMTFVQRRLNAYFDQVIATVRLVTAGDSQSLILQPPAGRAGEMTRAINELIEVQRALILKLSTENQKYGTVLTSMTDGVLITNGDGYVNLINPAATRLLEPMASPANGRSFSEVVRHHQLIELWQKAEMSGEEQVEAIDINQAIFLQAAVTPFQEDGARGFLIILHDLTQIRHLQTVRRDFISNISHELRTPLASIKAVTETLQSGALDDLPAAHRFLAQAENEVDVLTQMVDELMELSRIESGQVPFRFASTDVSSLLLSPLSRLRPLAQRKELQLVLDVSANLPPVLADEERMQRVATNLIHNAIKFTPPGGKITVQARLGRDSDPDVIISVKDSGVGIPPEARSRIFERFYKSDPARTRGGAGTGLGLAISRHIVQGHNGRIWVRSKEGKGSTFYFTLPIAEDL